jgi:preprotein translocase subunit SecA
LIFAALERGRFLRAAEIVEREAARLAVLDETAFATVRDAARAGLRRGRTERETALAALALLAQSSLGLLPRREQLAAALAMIEGRVAWLPAGSGKSLAVALAAAMHGWAGRACRVVAVAAYPARRDADRMAPFFAACDLSMDYLAEEGGEAGGEAGAHSAPRKEYDVLYAGARQLLAHDLREQILHGQVADPLRRRLRGLEGGAARAVVVDDADLVLIEEAASPLILTAPGDNPLLLEAVAAARQAADQLVAGRDYTHHPIRRELQFTATGRRSLEVLGERLPGIWRDPERRDDLIRQALGVRDLLREGRHYRVEEGRLTILDDSIVRLFSTRSWTHGLTQAIEARVGIASTPPARTLARLSFARFFRAHAVVGGVGRGMSGATSWIRREYRLESLPLVSAAPGRFRETRVYPGQDEKLAALTAAARESAEAGQAVLLVCRRLGDLEELGRRLAAENLAPVWLNPATLSPQALADLGQAGRITLSLGHPLRGVDLPSGLVVLLGEPHDLAYADQRIAAVVAEARRYLALDDDVLLQYLPRLARFVRDRGERPGLGRMLLRMAQALAAHTARKQGKLLARRDAQVNQQLAFTGEQDMDLGLLGHGKFGKDGT